MGVTIQYGFRELFNVAIDYGGGWWKWSKFWGKLGEVEDKLPHLGIIS